VPQTVTMNLVGSGDNQEQQHYSNKTTDVDLLLVSVIPYQSWIQQCYLHRMKEILTNPTEFGKVVLEEKKRDFCIQDKDLDKDLEWY
jgi:hypothetical protein